MNIELLDLDLIDMDDAVGFYVNYYNEYEGDEWSYQSAYKRIHQIKSREDSLCMVAVSNGEIVGILMGYFEQFYDLIQYNLVEIVVSKRYQNMGVGSYLMKELEKSVLDKGGSSIFLFSVADEHHEHFYGKNQYKDVDNFVAKVKFLK